MSPRDARPLSLFSALVGGAFQAGILALIWALPGWHLAFVGPGFASVALFLMAGPAGALVSGFMRVGHTNYEVIYLGKALKSAGSAVSLWMLWQHWPWILAALGIPAWVDRGLPVACGVFCFLAGVSVIINLRKMARHPSGPWRKKSMRSSDAQTGDFED